MSGKRSTATNLDDVDSFAAVCRAGGFRQAAKLSGKSSSALSEAIRRLETSTGVSLLNRTTRSVAPTEAGSRLLSGIDVALGEIWTTVSSLNAYKDTDSGNLCLNVPSAAARLVLPSLLDGFMMAYPNILVEVMIDDSAVDIVNAGCDAGIRYGELLSNDMTAVPIGPTWQRLITAAAPDYLKAHGVPYHPRDLLKHSCLRHKFPSGAMPPWRFARDSEVIEVDPKGSLIVSTLGTDLELDAAVQGHGIVYLFEDLMASRICNGSLCVVLDDWCKPFEGPKLYFNKRAVLPRPLRLFLDYVHRQVVLR